MRPIDADALKIRFNTQYECMYDENVVLDIIESAPTIDPVRHGLWLGEGDGYADGEIVIDVWHCSECGYCIDDGTDDPRRLPNYCPNCGSKNEADTMDECVVRLEG